MGSKYINDLSTSSLELVSTSDTTVPPEQQTSQQSIDSFQDYSARYVMSMNGPFNHRDRHYSKRIRRRLVYKNGECNISHANIRKRRQRFLADIFTTLVDIKWRWNLLIFTLGFTLSWLIFAMIWWLICFSHGDFEHFGEEEWEPCVHEVSDFATALLFSIETQHTIGYGSRQTAPKCPEAILVMMMQSCFGVIIQALMTGLVFAKLSRPKKRAETLMFSKNAVICKRDGKLCLMFRVGDMRKSHIVDTHIRAILMKKRITQEGEVLPLYQYEVSIGTGNNDDDDRLFLVWPTMIVHTIDEESPFYSMSAEELLREQFELIVILEGIVESTGMTTQARTSYLPGEVLWGHRFDRLVTFQKENGEYQIDYSRFHSTIPIDTPLCSAKDLADLPKEEKNGDAFDEEDDTNSSASDHSVKDFVTKQHGETQTSETLEDDSQILKSVNQRFEPYEEEKIKDPYII